MFDSVQLKLGGCLIRLQQYELLLKRILPHISYFGELTGLPAKLEENSKSLESKTLGTLVSMFSGTCLSSQDSIVPSEDMWAELPNSNGWVHHQVQLVFDAERYEFIKTGLKDLVTLRNDLVHHFVRLFDLNHSDGCAAAELYLDTSYRTIDAHYATLSGWAKSMGDLRTLLASTVQSSAFENFIDGIGTDGSIDWPRSGIVQGLRDAEVELAMSSWVPLESAIAWMRRKAPEQTLRRYGCSSWRQVLHESKQFEVMKGTPSELLNSNTLVASMVWYRSRRTTAGA
jgi:hypothetical protein